MGMTNSDCCQKKDELQFNLEDEKIGNKTMEPITFEPKVQQNQLLIDQAVRKNYQNEIISFIPPQKHNNSQLGQSKIAIEQQSPFKQSHIDFDKILKLEQHHHEQASVNDNLVAVPFAIIQLSFSQKLKARLEKFGNDILDKYKDSGHINRNWKLHKNGFYINILNQKSPSEKQEIKNVQEIAFTILKNNITSQVKAQPKFTDLNDLIVMVSEKNYYEGSLIIKEGKFLPHGNGVLINQVGIYRGSFSDGKAHGNGTFTNEDETVYKGNWQNGHLANGSIDNSEFKFVGNFKNGKANDKGTITFKKTETYYKGKFKDGQYQDEHALYKTKTFQYQGGFKDNKRNGQGVLKQIDLPLKKNDKKGKYKPPETFFGIWKEDVLQKKQRFSKSVIKSIEQ